MLARRGVPAISRPAPVACGEHEYSFIDFQISPDLVHEFRKEAGIFVHSPQTWDVLLSQAVRVVFVQGDRHFRHKLTFTHPVLHTTLNSKIPKGSEVIKAAKSHEKIWKL